jgi:hypothetical protein
MAVVGEILGHLLDDLSVSSPQWFLPMFIGHYPSSATAKVWLSTFRRRPKKCTLGTEIIEIV